MTKYILAGGNDRLDDSYGLRLAAEIYKHATHPIRVLSCFFADPESQWQTKASYWEEWLKKFLGDDVQYILGSLDTLVLQLEAADVVYLHGGESNELIVERMKAFPEIGRAFGGKIVVGSSAGVNYLSRKFWTRSKHQVMNGAGIVPVNVMVHYGSVDGGFKNGPVDWDEADAKMQAAVGAESILRLREGEFVVLEV